MCSTCEVSLERTRLDALPPLMSVAAHPIAWLPQDLLDESTRVERLLTAPARIVGTIDVVTSTVPRHSLQSHTFAYVNADQRGAPPVASVPASCGDVFNVVLKGTFTPAQRTALGKQYQVRRGVLRRLIESFVRFKNGWFAGSPELEQALDNIVAAPVSYVQLEGGDSERSMALPPMLICMDITFWTRWSATASANNRVSARRPRFSSVLTRRRAVPGTCNALRCLHSSVPMSLCVTST